MHLSTVVVPRKLRFRLVDIRDCRWLVPAWRCLARPLAVRRKRFFVPLCVFCFGMILPIWKAELTKTSQFTCQRPPWEGVLQKNCRVPPAPPQGKLEKCADKSAASPYNAAMNRVFPSSTTEAGENVWRELDRLLEDLAELSKSPATAADFHVACLQRVVHGLGVAGGALWVRSGDRTPEIVARIGPPAGDSKTADPPCSERVAGILDQGQGQAIPPGGTAVRGGTPNRSPFLLLLSPWSIGHEAAGVLEILGPPEASPQAQRAYLDFLQVAGELVADFHRNRQLRDYRLWTADLQRIQRFCQQVHQSLELEPTAYTLANELRQLTACDRVSVLVGRGKRYRVVAVSGVVTPDRRADAVRHLEGLVGQVAATGEPLWHAGPVADLAPQVEHRLQAHLDASHAKVVVVLPLSADAAGASAGAAEPVGALVVERFEGLLDSPLRWKLAAVRSHCALALDHAVELDRVPFFWLLRGFGRRTGWGRSRGGLVVGAVAAVLLAALALALIPAEFRVEARGELQPVRMRDVFAPVEGVVRELYVGHRQAVSADEVLAELRCVEWELQARQVWGELETARARFSAVEAERMRNLRETADQRQRARVLTAEREELREQIASLESQQAILERQQAELVVRSPLAGEVLTWDPGPLLEARPVSRGQVLLSIGDLDGPWQLELRIPDRRVAHVLAAQQRGGSQLPVAFRLASDPARTHHGRLAEVGLRTEWDEREGPFVLATVALVREQLPQRVPGATVTAKIHCGRRALGYVWFHDLWDALRRWLLF